MSTDRLFANGAFYHVYNRGVAKQPIFHDEQDFRQFLRSMSFYLEEPPWAGFSAGKRRPDELEEYLASESTAPLVRIHAYCLMPNHFHLLIEQVVEGGLSTFLRRVQLSYTRYYNTRYSRVGPLLQGTFQAVRVENDQQLLHVSRYIHLNPFVAKLASQPHAYEWSSLADCYGRKRSRLYSPQFLLGVAGSTEEYQRFVEDYASYAQDLHAFKDALLDA